MSRPICATTVVAALFFVLSATAFSAAPGTIKFGVADDTGKYASDSGAEFYNRIVTAGLGSDRVTVTWDAANPTVIADRPFLDRSIPEAAAQGVNLVMSVRPARAGAIGGSLVQAKRFAAYVALLATTYPTVKTFVIGNEPNQPRFWQPQFRNGKPVAGQDYERVLALSYDALKRVDPTITVVGGALSGRGNDNATAASNRSTSPLRFLYDLGRAYHASKRKAPLMDLFAFHPYPRSSLDSIKKGLEWPMAGYANLDRVKQALWDAFAGTGQKTTEDRARDHDRRGRMAGSCCLRASRQPLHGSRERAGRDGGAPGSRLRPARPARGAECDSTLKALFFMPFIDETSLSGFQSGLLRADGSERPSYTAVTNAIASSGGRCYGRRVVWQHTNTVLGARGFFPGLVVPKLASRQRAWGFAVRTAEDARYVATIVPANGPARTTYDVPGAPLATMEVAGYAKANWTPLVRFPKRFLPPGRYVYRVDLHAAFNPARHKVIVSRAFVVR